MAKTSQKKPTPFWWEALAERPAPAPPPDRNANTFSPPEETEGRLTPPLIPGGEPEKWCLQPPPRPDILFDFPLPPIERTPELPVSWRFYRWMLPEEEERR